MNSKNLMYVLPIVGSLVAGCVERTTKTYQVGNISITRETEDDREKVSFYSGCHFVSSDNLSGRGQVTIRTSTNPDCKNKSQVLEVEALLKIVEGHHHFQ